MINKTQPWLDLERIAATQGFNLSELFHSDPSRVSRYSLQAGSLHFDFSKHLVTDEVLTHLFKLVENAKVESLKRAMFAGEKINYTENRSVLHTALRRPANLPLLIDGVNIVEDVQTVLARMEIFARKVRSGEFFGSTGLPIDTVVNIGIGGSDLGPVMAYEALKHYSNRNLCFKFVSNVDESDLIEALIGCNPETTLFFVASKTFTTQETMTNARSAKEWLSTSLGTKFKPACHFVAISTNTALVEQFGIAEENIFGFWDWVGGRFSVDSAIGLSLMLAIGPDNFREFLNGFYEIDLYFLETPVSDSAIYWLALIGIWYRNFLDYPSYAVLPYENYLKRFPAYLQQLLMESNGKSVSADGEPLSIDTSGIYWGEPGTNGQHSFHQLLHQGTSIVPVDFLVGLESIHSDKNHHAMLFANALAQASVLAFGMTEQDILSEGTHPELAPHKVMPGNRPSTLITYRKLTPFVLGELIAIYEHVAFIQGAVWGIDSFDQWGVELGKKVANLILPALKTGDSTSLDSSTAAAVAAYRAANQPNQ